MVFFRQNLLILAILESPSRQFHHQGGLKRCLWGGQQYHHHMLNFMSFAKKHFKRTVFFHVFPICFCLHIWIFFWKQRPLQKFTQTPPRILLPQMVWFPGERGIGSSPCNSLTTVADATSGGAGGFHPDEGVHPRKMRIFWPPKKKPGKGGKSKVFEDGSPRKLIWGIMNPFWGADFSKGVGEKPPTWKTSWNSDVFDEIKK